MINTKTKNADTSFLPHESNWDRWAEVYRYEGAHRIFVRGLKKLFKPIIHVDGFIFRSRDLTIANSPIKARVPLEIRLLRIEEAEDFATMFNQSAERIRQRLAEGDQCMLGIVKGQMVHFQWFLVSSKVHHIPISQFGFALVIHPRDAYSYSGYTLRKWRGNGIAVEVSAVKHQYLKSLGYTRLIHYNKTDNVISTRSFGLKNGKNGTAARTVWVISLFRSRWRWIFGAANDQSFSFVRVP